MRDAPSSAAPDSASRVSSVVKRSGRRLGLWTSSPLFSITGSKARVRWWTSRLFSEVVITNEARTTIFTQKLRPRL